MDFEQKGEADASPVSSTRLDNLSDETEQNSAEQDTNAAATATATAVTVAPDSAERASLVRGDTLESDIQHDSFMSPEKSQRRKHPRLESLLPSDTYSFFTSGDYFSLQYSTCFCSLTFITAFGVMVIQLTTMSLLLSDVLDHDAVDNPLGIPGGADFAVRCTQVLALFIAVVSQDEVRLSLNLITHGYDPQLLREQIYSDISMMKWLGSLLARLGVGCFGLILTFVLIIRAETVRDLLLDFTAIEFVLVLDNALFLLARWGYLAQELSEQADKIAYTHHPLGESTKGQNWKRLWRVLFLMCIFGGMIGAWGYIVKQQNDGKYLPQSFFVQFSDDYDSTLSAFSGIYTYHGREGNLGNEYAYYKPASSTSLFADRAKFGYCHSKKAWAFSYDSAEADNVCHPSMALSPQTLSFDITKQNTKWSVVNQMSQLKRPLQHFFLTALRVYDGKACRSGNSCGSSGRFMCQEGQCVCSPEWFGLSCEFEAPCETMEVDEQFGIFADTRPRSTEYSLLRAEENSRIVTLHQRPIYASDKTSDGTIDLIFFTGRRWVLSNTNRFGEFAGLNDQNMTKSLLASFFGEGSFHAFWSNYTVLFISEAIDANTPSDATSPVGIRWYHAQNPTQEVTSSQKTSLQTANTNRESNAILLCGICSESNPCLYGNSCIDGSCLCSTGSTGRLCHLVPTSNGQCDPFFNDAEFLYDGGDCCQQSCESTDVHKCGTSNKDFSLPQFTGYKNCVDPSILCRSNNDRCWNHLYNIIGTERGTLSGNGAVVAVDSFPAPKVYEQDGAALFSRQLPIDEDQEVLGGKSFAFTDDGSILSVGFPRLESSGSAACNVNVYTYERRFQRYRPLGYTVQVPCVRDAYGPAVALSKDGFTMAVGAGVVWANSDGVGQVRVYKYDIGRHGYDWQQIGNTIEGTTGDNDILGYRVALSDDGLTLVASSPNTNEQSSGYVSVYQFEDGNWKVVGQMQGEKRLNLGDSDRFGTSIALSGSTLAIGAPNAPNGGYVQIYEFDKSSEEWLLMKQLNATPGSDLFGESFGQSVALSKNGHIVVGSPFADTTVGLDTGKASVFRWSKDALDWLPFLEAIGDEPFETKGYVVGISRDGSTIMVGTSGNNFRDEDLEQNGFIQIFHLDEEIDEETQPTNDDSNSSFVDVTIFIQMDLFPEQVGFRLICGTDLREMIPVGSFTEPSFAYQQAWRMKKDSTCEFSILDPTEDDGICCTYGAGFYKIYFGTNTLDDSMLLAQGGRLFGSKERVTFRASEPPAMSLVSINLEGGEFGNRDSLFTFVCDGFLDTGIHAENAFLNKGNSMIDTFLIPDGTECHMTLKDTECSGGSFRIWYGESENTLGQDIIASSDCVGCGTSVSFAVSRTSSVPVTVTELCTIQFYLRFDNYPTETGWSFTCGDTTLADYAEGYYSSSDLPSIQEMFEGIVNGTNCALFISDEYGDGLLGNGYYDVRVSWGGDHILEVNPPNFTYNISHDITVTC